jgi:L-aspartate oxidase
MAKLLEVEFNSTDGYELQNMITAAYLIARSALMRKESRGTHFREDFPQLDEKNWRKHIILKMSSDR